MTRIRRMFTDPIRGDPPDPLRAFLKDPVTGQQRVPLVERLREVVEKLFATVFETGRQIHH